MTVIPTCITTPTQWINQWISCGFPAAQRGAIPAITSKYRQRRRMGIATLPGTVDTVDNTESGAEGVSWRGITWGQPGDSCTRNYRFL